MVLLPCFLFGGASKSVGGVEWASITWIDKTTCVAAAFGFHNHCVSFAIIVISKSDDHFLISTFLISCFLFPHFWFYLTRDTYVRLASYTVDTCVMYVRVRVCMKVHQSAS